MRSRRGGYEATRPAESLRPPPPGPAPGGRRNCRCGYQGPTQTVADWAPCTRCDESYPPPPRQSDPALKGYLEGEPWGWWRRLARRFRQ